MSRLTRGLLVVLLAAGCRPSFDPEQGRSYPCSPDGGDAQCPGGWVCGLDRVCRDPLVGAPWACHQSADCVAGWTCGLDKLCRDPDAGGPWTCATDDDCTHDWRCGFARTCVDASGELLHFQGAPFSERVAPLEWPAQSTFGGAAPSAQHSAVGVQPFELAAVGASRTGTLLVRQDANGGSHLLRGAGPPFLGDGGVVAVGLMGGLLLALGTDELVVADDLDGGWWMDGGSAWHYPLNGAARLLTVSLDMEDRVGEAWALSRTNGFLRLSWYDGGLEVKSGDYDAGVDEVMVLQRLCPGERSLLTVPSGGAQLALFDGKSWTTTTLALTGAGDAGLVPLDGELKTLRARGASFAVQFTPHLALGALPSVLLTDTNQWGCPKGLPTVGEVGAVLPVPCDPWEELAESSVLPPMGLAPRTVPDAELVCRVPGDGVLRVVRSNTPTVTSRTFDGVQDLDLVSAEQTGYRGPEGQLWLGDRPSLADPFTLTQTPTAVYRQGAVQAEQGPLLYQEMLTDGFVRQAGPPRDVVVTSADEAGLVMDRRGEVLDLFDGGSPVARLPSALAPGSSSAALARLPSSGTVVLALDDGVWTSTRLPDGGAPLTLRVRPAASFRVESLAVHELSDGGFFEGYAAANLGLYHLTAPQPLLVRANELPVSEATMFVWYDGERARVMSTTGVVRSLPSGAQLSLELPSTIEAVATQCGLPVAITVGGLYRLEAGARGLGTWRWLETPGAVDFTQGRIDRVGDSLYAFTRHGAGWRVELDGGCQP